MIAMIVNLILLFSLLILPSDLWSEILPVNDTNIKYF